MGEILSGEEIAKEIRGELQKEVRLLKAENNLVPGLAVVLVGDNPASMSYIRGKRKACEDLGMYSTERNLAANVSEADVISVVEELNTAPEIHGILVQLPLPEGFTQENERNIINVVKPEKDVDGLHPINLGKLVRGEEGFLPCTPHGVKQILMRRNIKVEGKHVVIVGRSILVGRTLANILLQKEPGANATVTICHTGTQNLAEFTQQADILIVAAGRPNTVTPDMVREGTVVIDVGVNQVADSSRKRGYRLVGDVDFEGVREKASAITPVPGGVGPMTITMLLYNTVWAAKKFNGIS